MGNYWLDLVEEEHPPPPFWRLITNLFDIYQMIINFKLWLEGDGPHKFSSTQVQLPAPIAKEIIALGKQIPDKDLAEDGRETDIHITVKYGLHTNSPKEVKKIVADFGIIKATLGKTTLFPASDHHKFEVVKVDVISNDLYRLNKKIKKATTCTDTFPTYLPHLTIAYVKEGCGKKYTGSQFVGKKVEFTSVTFSDKIGNKFELPL